MQDYDFLCNMSTFRWGENEVNEERFRYNTERTFSGIIWIFFLHSDIVCGALYIWDNLVIIHYIMCLSGQCCLRTAARVSIFHQLVDFSIDVHTSWKDTDPTPIHSRRTRQDPDTPLSKKNRKISSEHNGERKKRRSARKLNKPAEQLDISYSGALNRPRLASDHSQRHNEQHKVTRNDVYHCTTLADSLVAK